MKGCPFCDEMKDMLKESKIDFNERDIDEYSEEYDKFVEATDNEFIPAFMLLDSEGVEVKEAVLMAPDRDFDDIHEALKKVKMFL
tara:strand:- start:1648 stop:1902 length:255 start_codon:yes stop_codon:yes gene_type:complete